VNVRIVGDGVAARCSAHLLRRGGYGVTLDAPPRPRIPTILLGEMAQRLLEDIFERPGLFAGLPRVTQRIVQWNAAPQVLPHSAVTVSEELLLRFLPQPSDTVPGHDWSVVSAPPLPGMAEMHSFGSRFAWPVAVEMRAGAETNACWIEAVDDGWLFLNAGWLASVGAAPEVLLEKSSLIASRIERFDPSHRKFPAYPRMAAPLTGEKWFACGSAAMAFDPICGDGTAHAVREAILASAAIRAMDGGQDRARVRAHYEARLTAGFARHLEECRRFYESGGNGPWWRAELEAIDRGLAWCRARLEAHGAFLYALHGFDLRVL
jgi:hypothetical protein